MANEYNRWFLRTGNEFSAAIDRFKGQPITYVEIGCFAGACCKWVAENILTHPDARGVGVDPYPPDGTRTPEQIAAVKENARQWLEPYVKAGKWRWVYHDSVSALRNFHKQLPATKRGPVIDCLYIDGLHLAHGALQDFVLAWKYLRVGSVVIFDDYGIGQRKNHRHVPEAVASVLSSFGPNPKKPGADFLKVINPGPLQFAVEVIRK